VKNDPLQEDTGLARVHQVRIEMRAIWRPTPCHDLGVDGQIEFSELADQNLSTGQLVAVQVKSGPSYFEDETLDGLRYSPSKKHRNYWAGMNLPVVLVLHNPTTGRTLFADVKSQMRNSGPIILSDDSAFDSSCRQVLLSICGREDDARRVLQKLHSAQLRLDENVTISGIEFMLAALDPRLGYVELRMGRIVRMMELTSASGRWVGIGQQTYDFILRCLIICTYRHRNGGTRLASRRL